MKRLRCHNHCTSTPLDSSNYFCDFDGRWDLLSIIIASCPTCYQVPSKNGYDQVYMDGNHCIIVNTGRASDLVLNNQVINTALL